MVRPHHLRLALKLAHLERRLALMLRRKGAVMGRMPVLRGDDQIIAAGCHHQVCHRHHLVAPGHGQGAAGAEIGLDVDQQQSAGHGQVLEGRNGCHHGKRQAGDQEGQSRGRLARGERAGHWRARGGDHAGGFLPVAWMVSSGPRLEVGRGAAGCLVELDRIGTLRRPVRCLVSCNSGLSAERTAPLG